MIKLLTGLGCWAFCYWADEHSGHNGTQWIHYGECILKSHFSNSSLFTSNMFGSCVVSTLSGLALWLVLMPSQCLSRAATDPAPFLQLLQELCTVFNVDLPCRVKSSQLGIISNKQTHTSAIVKPQSSSCSYICQHCLVHLGDIGELQKEGLGPGVLSVLSF